MPLRSRKLARQPRPVLTTDNGGVYRGPSQAGPGNDIHAGSPGLQKAPTRGPASLVQCYRGAASSCAVKSAHNLPRFGAMCAERKR
jgi:hypothetical protein